MECCSAKPGYEVDVHVLGFVTIHFNNYVWYIHTYIHTYILSYVYLVLLKVYSEMSSILVHKCSTNRGRHLNSQGKTGNIVQIVSICSVKSLFHVCFFRCHYFTPPPSFLLLRSLHFSLAQDKECIM